MTYYEQQLSSMIESNCLDEETMADFGVAYAAETGDESFLQDARLGLFILRADTPTGYFGYGSYSASRIGSWRTSRSETDTGRSCESVSCNTESIPYVGSNSCAKMRGGNTSVALGSSWRFSRSQSESHATFLRW